MMNDPMAGISEPTADAGPSGSQDNSKEVFDPVAMQVNKQRIERIRSVMGIVSGCVAGIVGLSGLQGFVCFALLHIFTCLCIWSVKMHGNLSMYTKQSWFSFITTSVQPTALSFTLFWTLFYGLVYLY